jgi:hypothetical protein
MGKRTTTKFEVLGKYKAAKYPQTFLFLFSVRITVED